VINKPIRGDENKRIIKILINKIVETDGLYEKYDLVIGNPPWGAELSDAAKEYISTEFKISNIENYDSYELFLFVAMRYLKKGGRLCYILPHTLLYPDKEKTRKILINNYKIEKWHYLGAEWFGSDIRMNTIMLQLKNDEPDEDNKFKSMLLIDEERKKAIKGTLNLSQLENAYSFDIPQRRSINDPNSLVELFRSDSDDPILERMDRMSTNLSLLCNRGRGVELNKAGVVVQCPACGKWLPPPRTKKNVPNDQLEKECAFCDHTFTWRESLGTNTIVSDNSTEFDTLFIDGDSIEGRYAPLIYRSIKTGYDGINYKDPSLYKGPKIVIRQAGVGIAASFDLSDAYCPQSVYVYKLKEEYSDIDHKFLIAVLLSRAVTYYIFKKFGEIDAAQAFSKLTHVRLSEIPIPINNRESDEWKAIHNDIVNLVDQMLQGEPLGGSVDWEIERKILELYNLISGENAHIIQQLGLTAYHKAMQQLFPNKRPPKPVRTEEIRIVE